MAAKCLNPFERADRRDAIDELESREFVQVKLRKLPPPIRRAVVAWSTGRSAAQIARDSRVSDDTIRNRIRQGLDLLRREAAAAN